MKTSLRAIEIDSCLGALSQGSFGTVTSKDKCDYWESCREVFHDDVTNLGTILFGNGKKKWEDIAAFVGRVENRLGLKEKSEFGPTTTTGVMWAKPPRWWNQCSIKRYFYTMMMRAAMQYSRKQRNFSKAMWSIGYTRYSRYAVERFLRGFTKYTGKNSRLEGWYDVFGHFAKVPPLRYQKDVNKLLVKP